MKKIMAAVDGSLASIHAAKKAVELAEALGAEVTLVHVTPPTILPGDVPIAPVAELREAERIKQSGLFQPQMSPGLPRQPEPPAGVTPALQPHGWQYMAYAFGTILAGFTAFLVLAWRKHDWPFFPPQPDEPSETPGPTFEPEGTS